MPDTGGRRVVIAVRPVGTSGGDGELPAGTRSISLFLVNRRKPQPDLLRDEGSVFQAELEVGAAEPLVPRPNVRNLADGDWDEKVADLQYRDACEFAVGHGVSTHAVVEADCTCRRVRTCWIAESEVPRVAPAAISGVTLEMEKLAALSDGNDAKAQLYTLVTSYRDWINQQKEAPLPAGTDRPRPHEQVLDFDIDELMVEVALEDQKKKIAALEDKGAVWDSNGRFYSLDGVAYDEFGERL